MPVTQTSNQKDAVVDTKQEVVVEAKPFQGNPDGPRSIAEYLRSKGTIYDCYIQDSVVTLRNRSGYIFKSGIEAKRTEDGNEIEPELSDAVKSDIDDLLLEIKRGKTADGRQV